MKLDFLRVLSLGPLGPVTLQREDELHLWGRLVDSEYFAVQVEYRALPTAEQIAWPCPSSSASPRDSPGPRTDRS